MSQVVAPCVCAIDPGLKGAVAFFFPTHPQTITAEDLPVVNGELNCSALAARLRQMMPDLVVVERVWSRPGEGVTSAFKFGTVCGGIRGVVAALGLPVQLVTPGVWKRHYGLSSDKEEARARAIQLWPGADCFTRKGDHGRAEAALLAKYGAEKFITPTLMVAAE